MTESDSFIKFKSDLVPVTHEFDGYTWWFCVDDPKEGGKFVFSLEELRALGGDLVLKGYMKDA